MKNGQNLLMRFISSVHDLSMKFFPKEKNFMVIITIPGAAILGGLSYIILNAIF